MLAYRIVFCKTCHLPMEIEHRAYWTVKACNLDMDRCRMERKLQVQELEKLRLEAYENSLIYKEKTKTFHDKKVLWKEFHVREKVEVHMGGSILYY